MLWAPTTAGYSLTSRRLRAALDGDEDPRRRLDADHAFCVLYELDEGDDWTRRARLDEGAADDRRHADARLRPALLRSTRSRRRDCKASSRPRCAIAGCTRRRRGCRWRPGTSAPIGTDSSRRSSMSAAGLAGPRGTRRHRRGRAAVRARGFVVAFVRCYLPAAVVRRDRVPCPSIACGPTAACWC